MQHVFLSDGSITIMSPTGPVTRTRSDFYYDKLINALDSESFTAIEPYLTSPACPDGVYHLYQGPRAVPFVTHILDAVTTHLIYTNGEWKSGVFTKTRSTYLGPYESFEAIYETHPELFI